MPLHLIEKHMIEKPDRMLVLFLLVVTLLRYAVIMITPLGLDVEEAQYWLWSTTPSTGYFSKPPMIAWLIMASTAIFGNGIFGIKALAPLIQMLCALLIWRIAALHATPLAGRIAALIWITLPSMAIAGFIISTDSPMLLFLMAAMLMLSPVARGKPLSTYSIMLAGVFTGLALMSKYAAIYFIIGITIWWLWQGRKEYRISPVPILVFSVSALACLSPNIIWNLANDFNTVIHLRHNADLEGSVLSLLRPMLFILSQGAIVGPVMLGIAAITVVLSWSKPEARFWIALATPALTIITIQSLFSNANANWTAASLPPIIVLVATWMGENWQHRWRYVAKAGIAINTALVAIAMLAIATGSLAPFASLASDPFRHLRGWDDHGTDLIGFVNMTGAGAVIAERRGIVAKLFWELRDTNIKIEIINPDDIPSNYYEKWHSWHPIATRRVVLITEQATADGKNAIAFDGESMRSVVAIGRGVRRDLGYFSGIEK